MLRRRRAYGRWMLLPRAPFGRTGHLSSRVIFGAAALAFMSQERADKLLPTILGAGINHLDVAADYGDAELLLAPWLAAHREKFFVATKTAQRTGAGARRELELSLQRLGVDSVDLIQLHNLVEPGDWATAHGPGGAVAALAAAREAGLVRFIGVTGHGLRIAEMHRRSLERFDFDSVLLPYNQALLADAGYRNQVEQLLEVCASREVAVQTIKSIARRRWRDADGSRHFAWYEPLQESGALDRAVRLVLSNPRLFLNSSSDVRLLPAIVAAAAGDLSRPSPEDLQADRDALQIEPLFDRELMERI
jgi:aryl-alcohol dehydrogenase-like predicted oxidoreductase